MILPKYANFSKLTLPIELFSDGMFIYGDLTMETLVEQRNDVRTKLCWPVSVWLPEANRFFNGRSSNISKNGAFISLPIVAPVIAGHLLEINFPRTSVLAKEKGQFARIKSGKILRVERRNVLKDATIGVAVAFE